MRYTVECNEEQFLFVAKYYKWENFIKEDLKRGNHVIYIEDDKAKAWDDVKKPRQNTIPFETWALVKGQVLKANNTIKLTSSYDAEVDYTTKIVKVGCQSIPFSKVEELAKLIKE